MSVADEIFELFQRRGAEAYFGERVTQLEHALQTAAFAAQARAGSPLVTAALVHDIGHLTGDLGEDAGEGIDARHEVEGQTWLASRFGEDVTGPVRLHVDAKRYLCAVDPGYLQQLSPASQRSLELQGGPYDAVQVAAFERGPHFRQAVQLRRWDDEAKIPGLRVAALEQYRTALEAVALAF